MSDVRRTDGRFRAVRRGVAALGLIGALILPTAVAGEEPVTNVAALAAVRGADRTVQVEKGQANGRKATVRPSKRAPKLTAKQKRGIQGMNEEAAPRFKQYRGPVPKAVGKAIKVPDANAQANPTTFSIFENRIIPFASGSQRSGVDEPSGGAAGRMRFVTGNWFASRSTDGGATWAFVNPFANYGFGFTNFCCDQVALYDASHDRWFWLRQYVDGALEVSNSSNLVNWCTYRFTRASFGLGTGNSFDYNHMAASTNMVYVGTHVYGPNAGELIFRMPIDAMVDCGNITFNWFGPRTTEFSESFVNGAGDIMYWGTNTVSNGLTSGSGFRIFAWPDDSNSLSIFDRTITPFTYMNFGGSQNCASANGTVLNWCQRTDSRMSGNGYIAFPSLAQTNSGGAPDTDAVIGFAFNANQDSTHPRPYVRRVYFRVRDMAYLGRTELYSTTVAILYPDMAPNVQGHVGIIFAWGGGTGTTTNFPSFGFVVDDDISQVQAWAFSYFLSGAGNPCLNTGDNRRRWGDYLTIQAMAPAKLVWVAEGFRMNAATNCVTGSSVPQVEVRQVLFGRNRDRASWSRWYTR